MITEKFLEYSRMIRDKSLSMGIPSIEEAEAYLLYTIVYLHSSSNRDHYVAIDAGAGIGYSTLWIAKALKDSMCNICVVEAVEKNKMFALEINNTLKHPDIQGVLFKVVVKDAIEYIRNKPAESIDLLFVDIEKNRYPKILEESYYKLKENGLIIFHNAIFPPPPQKLFEIITKFKLKYTIIPTSSGLLLALKR